MILFCNIEQVLCCSVYRNALVRGEHTGIAHLCQIKHKQLAHFLVILNLLV